MSKKQIFIQNFPQNNSNPEKGKLRVLCDVLSPPIFRASFRRILCVFLRSSQDGILCKNAANGPSETAKNDNHTYMRSREAFWDPKLAFLQNDGLLDSMALCKIKWLLKRT